MQSSTCLTVLFAAVLSVVTFAFQGPAVAGSKNLTSSEIFTRINIAGRQRMLSQRMAKAACFTIAGIDADAQRKVAQKATKEFSENLSELLDGGPRFQGSTDPAIREALDQVLVMSLPLTRAVNQIAAGDKHTVIVTQMLTQNMPTFLQLDQIVGMMEKSGAAGALPAGVASTINQAGLQRMLSQRMSKDLCLSYIGLKTTASRQELRKAIDQFDNTLEGLRNGAPDLGIVAAPTPEVARQLAIVADHWSEVKVEMERVAGGAKGELATLLETAAKLDLILNEMDRALTLWQEYGENRS